MLRLSKTANGTAFYGDTLDDIPGHFVELKDGDTFICVREM